MTGPPLCPICGNPIYAEELRLKRPFRCPDCAALLRVIHPGGGELAAGLIGAKCGRCVRPRINRNARSVRHIHRGTHSHPRAERPRHLEGRMYVGAQEEIVQTQVCRSDVDIEVATHDWQGALRGKGCHERP